MERISKVFDVSRRKPVLKCDSSYTILAMLICFAARSTMMLNSVITVLLAVPLGCSPPTTFFSSTPRERYCLSWTFTMSDLKLSFSIMRASALSLLLPNEYGSRTISKYTCAMWMGLSEHCSFFVALISLHYIRTKASTFLSCAWLSKNLVIFLYF